MEKMTERKHFTRTVATFVGAWMCYWLAMRFATAAIAASSTFTINSSLLSLFSFIEGLNLGIGIAAALQVAIWWSWYRPAGSRRSRWRTMSLLLFLLFAAQLLQHAIYLLPMYFELGSTTTSPFVAPLVLTVLFGIGSMLSVMSYLASIYFLSSLVRVEMRALECVSDEPIRRGQWTIASLMLATGLVALLLAMSRLLTQLHQHYYADLNVVAGSSGALLIGLVYQVVDAFCKVGLVIAIAHYPQGRMYQVRRYLPVVIATSITCIAEWMHLTLGYAGVFASSDAWSWILTSFFRSASSLLTIDIVTRWFIRRWRSAGLVPVSSLGTTPIQSLPATQT